MLEPLVDGLDVAVEHGGVGAQTEPVGSARHLQPALAGEFVRAGELADARVEHLGPAAGHGAQARVHEQAQGLVHRFAGKPGQVVDLHAGEGLQVHVRADLADGAEHVHVIGERQVRVDAADDVDLADRLVQPLTDLGADLVQAHLVGQRVTLGTAEGAELAQVGADVRVVDVLVVDEVGAVAVLPLADDVGEVAEGEDVRVVVEATAVVQGQAFARPDLVEDVAEPGLGDESVHGVLLARDGCKKRSPLGRQGARSGVAERRLSRGKSAVFRGGWSGATG